MKRGLLLLVIWLAACGDDPTSPCDAWGGCLAGEQFVARVEVDTAAFARNGALNGRAVPAPGDSVLVRYWLENHGTTLPGDSVWLYMHRLRRVLPPSPGSRLEFTDTLVVRMSAKPHLELKPRVSADTGDVSVRLLGDTAVSVLPVDLALEVIAMAQPTVFDFRNGFFHRESVNGARLLRKAETGALLSVRNKLNLAAPALDFGFCLWDQDHCITGAAEGSIAPLEGLASQTVALRFTPNDTATGWAWYARAHAVIGLCAVLDGSDQHAAYEAEHCVEHYLEMVPNFEAECGPIQTITVPATVTDQAPECGRFSERGSIYRFEARAGERYRIASQSGGRVFLSGPNGLHGILDWPYQTELTIRTAGSYYVIVEHSATASFTLVRE